MSAYLILLLATRRRIDAMIAAQIITTALSAISISEANIQIMRLGISSTPEIPAKAWCNFTYLPTSGTNVHASWHTNDKASRIEKAGETLKVGPNHEKKNTTKGGKTTVKRAA
jgi:hypothetical protein